MQTSWRYSKTDQSAKCVILYIPLLSRSRASFTAMPMQLGSWRLSASNSSQRTDPISLRSCGSTNYLSSEGTDDNTGLAETRGNGWKISGLKHLHCSYNKVSANDLKIKTNGYFKIMSHIEHLKCNICTIIASIEHAISANCPC